MRALPFARLMLAFVGLSLAAAAIVLAARRSMHAGSGRIGRIR